METTTGLAIEAASFFAAPKKIQRKARPRGFNTAGKAHKKTGTDQTDHYEANLLQATDYYAFGSPKPARTYNPADITCEKLKSAVSDYQSFYTPTGLLNTTQLKTYLDGKLFAFISEDDYMAALRRCNLLDEYLVFNGSDNYVNHGSATQFNMGTGDFTIEAWVNTSSSSDQFIVTKYDGSLDYGYKLWLESGNQVKLGVYENGNYAELNTTLGLSTNNWHHVVAQKIGNDASDFKIYIDGVSLGFTTNNSGTLPGNIDNVQFFTVGGESMNSKPFSGKMKDVRMYTRVLTADEIAVHYSGGCGTNNLYLTSLVLWDKMNDGTGSTVQDYSTYGGVYPHTGTTMTWGREVNTTCTTDRKVAIEMNGKGYRFGFNGMEKADETNGNGNHYLTAFRDYDPRLGHWWSIDPKASDFPWQSPYIAFDNNPILLVDPNGLSGEDPQKHKVEKGNTLSGIAKSNNTTVDKLMKLNPQIKDKNKIFTGQEITLSSSSENEEQPSASSPSTGNAEPPAQSGQAKPGSTATNPQGQQQQSKGVLEGGEHVVGPAMYLLGQPIKALKPVGALGSTPGSSIASKTLSKVFPQTFTNTLGKQIGTKVATNIGTNVIGRAAGRAVPVVGLVLTVYDVVTNWFPAAKEGLRSYDAKYPIEKPGNLIYHTCFEKGTLVVTREGLTSIEKIKRGDLVYTYNIEKDIIELGKVLNTLEQSTGEIYEVKTTTQTISVTSEHPFYVKRKGWVTVKELKRGDLFKTTQNAFSEQVKDIRATKRTLMVYNIEVDGNHNYFVTSSSILVHNKHIQPPQKLEEVKKKVYSITKNEGIKD